MGIYVVTGGTKGIGKSAKDALIAKGHEVVNIDVDGGDINVDLGTANGRAQAVSQLHERYPDGIDGLICNHGIGSLPKFRNSYILAVNYFGAVAIMEGLYNLLKMKKGSCAAVVSGQIAAASPGKYHVDGLLNNCGDEARICRLVDSFPPQDLRIVQYPLVMYESAKIALARWVRRASPTWAANGVRLNAVAPGGVRTTIMQDFVMPDKDTYFYPMPALLREKRMLEPAEVAEALVFLVSPESRGINGTVFYCDAGASAVFDSESYL